MGGSPRLTRGTSFAEKAGVKSLNPSHLGEIRPLELVSRKWNASWVLILLQNHKILYFVDPSSSKSSFESPDSGLGSQNLRPNSGNEGLLQTTFMGIYMKFNISGELCVFLHVFWDFLRFLLKISFIFYQGIWGKTWKWPDSEILRGDEILGSLIKTV